MLVVLFRPSTCLYTHVQSLSLSLSLSLSRCLSLCLSLSHSPSLPLSLSLSLSHMYILKPEQVYMWKSSGFGQLEWKLILCSEQNPNYGQLPIDDVATWPNLKLSCNSPGTQ